jgi:ribonuclease inhibitor
VSGARAVLDGREMRTRDQFHAAVKRELSLPEYYGNNLDALWDSLTTDVPRPVSIEWNHSALSREYLGEYFDQIRSLLEDLKRQDPDFSFELR